MKAKLNTLLNSEKGQENGKKSILGAFKEYQTEDKENPKESKEKLKESEKRRFVGVVFRAAPALFLLWNYRMF
jgi:hypothetical protein